MECAGREPPSIRLAGSGRRDRGFTLVEALVATAVIVTVLASLAALLTTAGEAVGRSRASTAAVLAAMDKIEQLQSLEWTYALDGTPLSDLSSDTAVVPPAPSGGTGLSNSPAGTLTSSTTGWVDYLDPEGTVIGSGADVPPGTLLIRRWAVRSLDAAGTLVIDVCVSRFTGGAERQPEACLSTVRARQP
ncbi:MAG: prepilin-type N-terminal cleavage/methylation domain-containing protein [Vicinamibacterales bacterium]